MGPGWAVEDDGSAGSSMLERRMGENSRKEGGLDFEYENWYFKFKSLNLGVWLYIIGFFQMDQGHYIRWPSPHINILCIIYFLFVL